jgi:cell wall-associated NlpC family hydrolase
MRKAVLLLTLLMVPLWGCSPYPRYTKNPAVTPEEQGPVAGQLSTDDYLRLGLILQKYLGKPYVGRSKWERGMDCSKFTSDVYREFNGTILPRTAAEQFKLGRKAPARRLKFGDLVFFNTDGKGVSHVGVYIEFNQFIHASTTHGVIISSLNEKYWAQHYIGARRLLD